MERKPSVGEAALGRWLDKWQAMLGLKDWSIRLELVEFVRERQSGDIRVDAESKQALLMLARMPWRRDEELVLVHELLHLVLWHLDRLLEESVGLAFAEPRQRKFATNRQLETLEVACEQLARALIRSERGCEPELDFESLAEDSRDRVRREEP